MKKLLINLGNRLFIPTCLVLISYFLFYEGLKSLPFINLIRWVILGILGIFALSIFLSLSNNYNRKNQSFSFLKTKSIALILYFYSEHIVNYSFYTYFFIYMILELDKKNVLYNYLLLLLFGIFLGYRIAMKACFLTKRQ